MKPQLSNTIYVLKFAMEKNDFERLKSSSEKKRNDFVANPTWPLLFGVVDNFPTLSRKTLSKGAAGVSVTSIGSRIRVRTSFYSKQLLQPRMNSVIWSRNPGQVYRSLVRLCVLVMPLWPLIRLLWYSSIILGLSLRGGTSILLWQRRW